MSLNIVILAAGQGTRMKSSLPKVIHKLAGKPLVQHVIDTAKELEPTQISLVYGHKAEVLKSVVVDTDINWVEQKEQLGTGHAVAQVLPNFKDGDDSQVLILYGDVPLIQADTLREFNSVSQGKLGILTVTLANSTGYGRIIRDDSGSVVAIVEEKDATPEQKEIKEINTGIMSVPASFLATWLPKLSNSNAQGEYYLTDIVEMAVQDDIPIVTGNPESNYEVEGVNNRVQLAELERTYQLAKANELMLSGATLIDPKRIDIRGTLEVGHDVTIDVNCVFEGNVVLESNVQIGPNCVLKDCKVGEGSVIEAFSHIDGSNLESKVTVGPYGRLRPGTKLASGAKVGNFVEIKKSEIGEGSKVNHLSYVGDAQVGAKVNIGAGTITCNYDGANKFKTEIDDDVFVGSNSALVAPVKLGKGATVGAGTTVTKNVADNELSIARAKQRNIANWQRPVKEPK